MTVEEQAAARDAELAAWDGPTCGKCGVPVTTGAMAMICPYQEKCEFWPDDECGQEFVRWWRGEWPQPPRCGCHGKEDEENSLREATSNAIVRSLLRGQEQGFKRARLTLLPTQHNNVHA